MTGSGKTTFISKVTGAKDLEIGHSLTSCTFSLGGSSLVGPTDTSTLQGTQEVRTTRTTIDGRVVHFVDTPGFSDTHLSDTEVLELIAKYLAAAYKDDVKLSGIIYLHPISETRMTSHATRNLQMFQKLTGDPNLKSVVLVTSMWDRVSEPEGLARQRELEGKFWKVLLACGAKVMRYEGTPGSARSIAGTLMGNTPFFVQIQKEMGQGNKALRDTAAGQQVMEQLMLMKETHERQLAEMAEKLRNSAALNKKLVDALNERYQAELRALQKARNDERRLNEENMDTLRARLAVLETGKRCTVM
ncbi:hypothetical protein F4802DRAFT_49583 [Xylaria palmicola]|nr:hypothetical protein F4802DRAFT_49583 [Xylaria palmicola]